MEPIRRHCARCALPLDEAPVVHVRRLWLCADCVTLAETPAGSALLDPRADEASRDR